MSTEQLSNKDVLEDKSLDTLDLLKSLPDEEPEEKVEEDLLAQPKAGAETKTEKDDEDERLEIPEEDEEKVDDEKLDTIATPPKRKEILAAYPDLFKKFPYLESAYYREQQFTEIYPTLENAKETKERAEVLGKFEEQLFSGSADTILQSVKEADSEAFARVVDNLLPNLQRVDNTAYLHTIGNIGKMTIVAMMNEAKNSQNEVLENAATVLHQFLFGNSQWQPITTYGKPIAQDNESKKLADERAQFVQEKFESAKGDLETRTTNSIKSTVMQYIDPKDQMSAYVKGKAGDDCMDLLDKALNADTRYKAALDAQWENAFRENFSKASMDKISSMVKSKARALLPDLISKIRKEALNGSGRSSGNVEQKRGPVKPGRTASPNSSGNSKLQIPKGMSTKQFLLSD